MGLHREAVTSAGRWVGPYQVLQRLGEGGMGTVYLTRREVVSGIYRKYAAKVLRADRAGDPTYADALLREARLGARVRHANAVSVVEVGEHGGDVFVIMEYIEGGSLKALARAAREGGSELPLPVLVRILLDALAGLHELHELRDDAGQPLEFVHRDVSPDNLLVGVDGVTRITDLGIARARDETAQTTTGLLKGKIRYMAPEHALGERLDRRADVWAVGVIAWELLSGKSIFNGANDAAYLLKLAQRAPIPPLIDARADLPVELDEVVQEALRFQSTERLASADAFRVRLAAAARATCGVADAAEVGALVERLMAGDLARLRGPAPASDSPSGIAALEPVEPPVTKPTPEPTAPTVITTRRRGRGWIALPIGVAAAALVYALASPDEPRPPAQVAPSAPTPSSSSAPDPAPTSPPDPSVTPVDVPPPPIAPQTPVTPAPPPPPAPIDLTRPRPAPAPKPTPKPPPENPY